MAKNVGEYDELRIKLRLIQLRDSNKEIVIDGKIFKITSIGLEAEFGSIPAGINLQKMSDRDIEKLANQLGAGKSKGSYKADVNINGEGFSVKSHRSAPPAIVNHTPRWGWVRICNAIGVDITPLDNMVEKYFELRRHGTVNEDVWNTDPNSPFAPYKEYFRPILNYFLFKGTGQGASKYPAKYVLDCKDPYDITTWKIYDESNYLDIFWSQMKFSMRNKGFTSYPYKRKSDSWKIPLSQPWAQKFDGTLKGSLHIRVE